MRGRWSIKDSGGGEQLVVEIDGELYEFSFAQNDPMSRAIVILLNNLPHLLSAFRSA